MGFLYAEILCCLISVLVSCTGAQQGESLWCVIEDVGDPGMPIPRIREYYSTNIELNFENDQFSYQVRRTLHENFNKSTVEILGRDRHVKYITLGNEGTFVTIKYTEKGPSCSAKEISGKSGQDLYGDDDKVIVGVLVGIERLLSSEKEKFKYTGPSNVKGVYVQQWQTCAFLSEINDAVLLTISFQDSSWKPPYPVYPTAVPETTMTGVPVEIYMKIPGKLLKSKDFTDLITADFTNFLPFAPSDAEFQPPEDVHCTGLRTDVKRPPIQNYFRYSAEVITHKGSTDVATVVSYRTVYYDYKEGLVRIDLQEPSEKNTATTAPLGTVVASVIRDFKAGIEYRIDASTGSCEVGSFKDTYDVFGTNDVSGDILTSTKYFYLDNSDISCLGQYSHRGLMTDVFSGLAKVKDKSTILRWYFTVDKVQLIEDQRLRQNVLVKMVSKPESSIGKDGMTEINFYNFAEREPSFFTYDVSACYNETLSKTFILQFPGDMKPFMQESTDAIKEKVHKTLKEATGLSKTRISVQEVILRSSFLYAQFTILDIPPVGMKTGEGEITLKDAEKNLQTALSNGTVQISLPLKDNIVVLKGDPLGLKEYSKEEKNTPLHQGLAQGSVIGLAFGMIILGFLMGAAVINIIISRKHGVSLFQSGGNSATSYTNPLNESSM